MYDIQSIFDIHIIENVSMGPHMNVHIIIYIYLPNPICCHRFTNNLDVW